MGGITALYLCAVQHQNGNLCNCGVWIIEMFCTWAGGLALLCNTQQFFSITSIIFCFLRTISIALFMLSVALATSCWSVHSCKAQGRGVSAEGLCNGDRKERELLICGKFWHFETNNYCRAWWMVTLVKFPANWFVRSLGSVPSRHVFSIMSNRFSLVLLNQNEQSPRESCRPFN